MENFKNIFERKNFSSIPTTLEEKYFTYSPL